MIGSRENNEMMPQDTAWYGYHAGSSEKGNKVKEKFPVKYPEKTTAGQTNVAGGEVLSIKY